MGRKELESLQLERLKALVDYCDRNVEFYHRRLSAAGVTADRIKTLADIEYIPFTTKADLRDTYPFGMFSVPKKQLVRIHASSGTTGNPTVVGYTEQDIDMWATCVARLCAAGGATREDIAQISFGYGLFTGALGLHFGLAKLGAAVVPISSGNTERQIQLMADFGSTVLVATPSYALYMAEVAERMGMMDKIQLRVGLFGAEGSTEEMRAELERRWGIVATENYGMSELIGPGVSGDCTEKCGMHINEDYFYCEVVDPATGEPVPEGEWGELVVTPLMKQALPLLRYRTHDITRLLPGPCKCGRTTTRMQKIAGRTDDMLIIRGVNVFPSQIETVLLNHGYPANYQIIVDRVRSTDTLDVQVEMTPEMFTDNMGEIERRQKELVDGLRSMLGLAAKVTAEDGSYTWEFPEGQSLESITVSISMKEQGGYYDQYLIHQLTRTDERADYASDAVFANFRNVAVGDLGENAFFRSSSPVNNELGRASYADDLAEAGGIQAVMNLADSNELIEGYIAAEGFDPATIAEDGMGVDEVGNTFKQGTVDVDGTAYTWKVSALPLSEMYDISGLPETAVYVGVRLSS